MTSAGLHQRLGRSERLRKRSGFLLVQQHGRRISGRTLVVYAMLRTQGIDTHKARLGVTVGKKVGNAVTRNRIKRWLRESYRRLERATDLDLVVIAKPAAAENSFAATSSELRNLLSRVQAQ